MAIICLALALLLVAIDQIIKYLVILYVKPVSSVVAIPHILDLSYVENTGVAFGMFKDLRWLFVLLTSIVIVVFIVLLFKMGKKSKLFSISAALIIGGGIGNLIDRLLYGYVIDYLSLSFFPPVCNFADYCISIGSVLLIVYLLFFYDDSKNINDNEKCDG